ncbi:MAG: hypothetical protein EOO11_01910 [Chitinophagaceae bacterium]|nr:MAG: hypothetical protein EOO11_01910 [Chitinophagaceae bacterium]
MQRLKHILLLAISISACSVELRAQPDAAFRKISPLSERLHPLPFGAVRPEGWLREQVTQNLAGYTGHLDSLVPALVVKDDIYGRDRLTRKVKAKDVGATGAPGDWQVQFLWWNSETQSNWWDGYVRSAILAGDPVHLERVRAYVARILAMQDADGYLGIYDRDLRYRFDNENGELWAKATLLRSLLAWQAYTGDKKLFTAIERAVRNVMTNLPAASAHPFHSVNPNVGGLSHGLMFTDVLEAMHRLTGKQEYLDYLLFCYRDFSQQVLNEDAQAHKLLDPKRPLGGHGVHTYEHLRTVAAAYYATGNPVLKAALGNFLKKIEATTAPSGGPVGDEWIGGRPADATTRGYEYCSLQELLHSYAELQLKSGSAHYGDAVERLFFNAAQGARHPEESSIAYLKSDNSYAMTGPLNGDTVDKQQVRYKYSPVHQDAAVCCVPNAGRIAPYYIQHLWAQDHEGFVATLLGPSVLRAKWNGKPMIIRERTTYPYGTQVTMEVEGAAPSFVLKIRRPAWAKSAKINLLYTEQDGYLVIRNAWKGRTLVQLEWEAEVMPHVDPKGDTYFTYAGLVLARPVEGVAKEVKTFPLPGFRDLHYTPRLAAVPYRLLPGAVPAKGPDGLRFEVPMVDPATGQEVRATLIPMGRTILRQVTFPNQ